MSRYAAGTMVPVERSQGEIRRILTRYGATRFSMAEDTAKIALAFSVHNRMIKFIIWMPAAPTSSSTAASKRTYEQICRQRWRQLILVLKAKFEAVETGIETFESAFMAHIVLPDGKIFGEWAQPQIEQSYKDGKMPPLLGGN